MISTYTSTSLLLILSIPSIINGGMVKLSSEVEDPTGRIAFLGSSGGSGSENNNNSKTIKILTGQSGTINMNQQQQQQQRPGPGYYPNYPASPNQGDLSGQGSGPHPNYPGSPNQGDLSGQGSGPHPNYQQRPPQGQPETTGVPEAYVQIIGAIEKLVGRMDKIEARLHTVENIMYHLTTNKKEEPQKGSCPEGFVKIDGIKGKCYHISTLIKSPKAVFDWQTAHAECGKKGGRLSEMINYDDFLRISKFLTKYGNTKGNPSPTGSTDFWVGGINPGLIWIWSESGHQVGMDKRFWNENDNSSNLPGCLKLSYSLRLDSYFFKGTPCMQSHNILCEVMDNTVSRALARFEEELSTGEVASGNSPFRL